MLYIFFAKTKNPKGGNPRSNYIVVAGKIRGNDPSWKYVYFHFLNFVFELNVLSTSVCRSRRARLPGVFRPGRLYRVRVNTCTELVRVRQGIF